MRKLTLGSFKREGAQGSFGHTFTHKLEGGGEICLESCLAGYCVGKYDKNLNLIGEKKCTKIDGMLESQIASGFSIMSGEALEKAIKIANKLRQKNISCSVSLDKVGKSLEYANSLSIPFAVFVGQEEIESKKFKIKNMASGEEKLLNEKQLIKFLEK